MTRSVLPELVVTVEHGEIMVYHLQHGRHGLVGKFATPGPALEAGLLDLQRRFPDARLRLEEN